PTLLRRTRGGNEVHVGGIHHHQVPHRFWVYGGGLVPAVVVSKDTIAAIRHHRRDSDRWIAEEVIGGAAVLHPSPWPSHCWIVFLRQPQRQCIHIGLRSVRIENPGVFRHREILKPCRRVDTHCRYCSFDTFLVLFEVIHRAVTLTHPQNPNGAF